MKKILYILMFLMSNIANADCWYNGSVYPTGSVVNGLTCQTNGSWR